MPKKKKLNPHHKRKIIRRRSFFILSKWLAISTIIIIIVLGIVTEGKFLSIAGIFLKPTPTPTPPLPTDLYKDRSTDEYLELSVKDLTGKLGIKRDDIRIVSVVEKSWPNASLNCPEKGKIYAQMIVPGFVISLEALGKIYNYHAGLDHVVTCQGS